MLSWVDKHVVPVLSVKLETDIGRQDKLRTLAATVTKVNLQLIMKH